MARSLTVEEHSVGLAANAIRWLLENGEFSHPGLKAHLTAAETQLVACRALLEVAP